MASGTCVTSDALLANTVHIHHSVPALERVNSAVLTSEQEGLASARSSAMAAVVFSKAP